MLCAEGTKQRGLLQLLQDIDIQLLQDIDIQDTDIAAANCQTLAELSWRRV